VRDAANWVADCTARYKLHVITDILRWKLEVALPSVVKPA